MKRHLKVLLLAAIFVPIALAICLPALALAETPGFSSLKELDGKRIGVQTGSTFDAITKQSLPNAKIEYYNTYADLAEAVTSNKIDGFPGDEPVIQLIATENPRLKILDDRLDSFEFGVVLPKSTEGDALRRSSTTGLCATEIPATSKGSQKSGSRVPRPKRPCRTTAPFPPRRACS